MTTYEHEAPLRLLQDNPKLAEELYCGLLGRTLPDHTDVRPGSEAMTREHEAVVRNCDNVAVYYRGDKAVFALLFEVQLGTDRDKHYSWLDYIASARSRLKCPVALVVITFDGATARWAAQPIDTGHPAFILVPLVIGPGQIPAITDPQEGRENLQFALLSLVAHAGGEQGDAVMRAYIESIRDLDQQEWSRYAEYALNALRGEQFMALQEMIMSDTRLPNTYRLGLFGEKYREGLAEGRLKEAREFVVFVLQQRGVKVTESMRSRIESYDDPEKLRSIAGRAMSTYNISDLFSDDSD